MRSNKNRTSAYRPIVPAVEQASRIMLCLGENPRFRMRLTDICRQVGIYKSKGYSILNTLGQFGLVEKDLETKTYFLGPNLIFLSHRVLSQMHYPEIAAPFLESLSRRTEGMAVLCLIRDTDLIVIAKRQGNQNIGFNLEVGHKLPITLGAHGKALAAFMGEEERERLFEEKKLYFYGDPCRMDMKRLKKEMTACRDRGFAQDIGEVTPGVNTVCSPVLGLHDKIIGSIILAGTFPESAIEEYGPMVAVAAKRISQEIAAYPEQAPLPDRKNGLRKSRIPVSR